MRTLFIAATILLLVSSTCFAKDIKSREDKVSYGIGYTLGTQIKEKIDSDYKNLDRTLILKGLEDAFNAKDSALTDEDIQNAFMEYDSEQRKIISENNKAAGAEFLATNAKRKEVVTLKSGLQYEVIKKGTGASPQKGDTVIVNYRGSLLDGTEFDSSYKRGEPAEFQVDRLIPGMTEGLLLMKEGAVWKLFLPASIAYGDRAVGSIIEANSTLIFEVELISIKKK